MKPSLVRPAVTAAFSLLALVGLTVQPATAQEVTPIRKWTFPDNQATIFLDRTYAGGVADTFDDYIGAQDTTLTGIPGSPYSFDAYCIDAAADIQRPITPVGIHSTDAFPIGLPGLPAGQTHGGAAAWLLNNYYATAFTDNRASAALQLAIWEVVEDWNGLSSSIDLSAGNLRYLGNPGDALITDDISSRANGMLADWNGKQDQALWFDGLPNTNNINPQDLIGPRFGNAPEPNSLALMLLPVAGIALTLRRRKNNAAVSTQ